MAYPGRTLAVSPVPTERSGRPGPTRALWSWGVFTSALGGMLVIYRSLWADPLHGTLGSRDHINDPMQMMWFLKWVPWQILHGHNPFTTDALFYPHGVSLVWNTLTPTLGIIAAPITLTVGPALSFAVLMTLGPPLTALTGFWWLRRYTTHPAPAAAGGLLLAFDPYMSGHLLGHLNLVFAPLVPLMLMLAEDLLWRRPRSQRRTAVYLGLVTAAQLGISEELVLLAAVGSLVALVFALCVLRRPTVVALRMAWPGLLLAVGVFLALASPLLVSQLFLAPTVTVDTSRFRAVGADYAMASTRQLISPARPHESFLGVAENGVYLGSALIAVLIVGIMLTVRRDRLVRIATGTLVVLVLLTFGINGIPHLWLPWRLLVRLPALESVIPGRFAFGSFFVIAWLLSRWADQLLAARRSVPTRWDRVVATGALVALAASLVPLIPRSVPSYPLPVGVSFFSSAQERALLPAGAPVLLLPSSDARGMYYQQQADFRFRQSGGYALLPPSSAATGGATQVLDQLGVRARDVKDWNLSDQSISSGRIALCQLHLAAILVVGTAPEAARLAELAERLTGGPADEVSGGVSVWLQPCR
jgi:hypothetical protein